jgi:hypothetical protein
MARFTLAAIHAGTPAAPLPLAAAERASLKHELRTNAPDAYWDGAARAALRANPDALD